MKDYPKRIQITEVGPRDGLQNQSTTIPTQTKIALVNALSQTGLQRIETSAFVHPSWIPQLADADEVFNGIKRNEKVLYTALVPNERGWIRALEASVDEIAVLTAVSETFCMKNTNASIEDSIHRLEPIVKAASTRGIRVRGYISCVIACPYEGETDLIAVRHVTERLLDIGIDDIVFGETIGVAVPKDICRLYDAVDGVISPEDSILHLHDTRGTALVCAAEAMRCGVFQFDASCGGLGGCPYAVGAAGNIATEDLVYFAQRMGIETGVDLEALIAASSIIETALHTPLRSRAYRAFQDLQTLPSE